MKKLKVVQIGTAHDHAADTYETLRALRGDYELLGVCEPDGAQRAKAAAGGRYPDAVWMSLSDVLALDGLDAVVVESEEEKLVGYAQLFVDRGLPIHMDKPCGEDYPAFRRLIETVKGRNIPFHVGYMYRYNAAVKRCRELKESGRLGDIFCVEAQMSVLHNAEKRAWLSKFKGGMMFFLGCHLVDLVYMMCGEPEEVIPYNTSTGNGGVESEDYAFALFRYKNGVSFVKACASEVNGFDRRQLVVTGTKGTVHIQPLELRTGGADFEQTSPAHITFYEDGIRHPFGKAGSDVQFPPFGRYLEMMRDFAGIVRGEHENRYSYDYELAVQRLVLQACGNWKGNRK